GDEVGRQVHGGQVGKKSRQAEIQYLDGSLRRQHEIVRRDVAMQDAAIQCVLHSSSCLLRVLTSLLDRQRAALEHYPVQAHSIHQFHHEETRVAHQICIINGDNVGMAKLGRGLHLREESFLHFSVAYQAFLDDLDGHKTPEEKMFSLENRPHAAACDHFKNAISVMFRQAG